MTGPSDDILARLDRLESREEIRQLASKYALALDMRDMDAMANLFVAGVSAGGGKHGRQALRDWLDDTMRKQFEGTSHHVGTQIVEFIDADNAVGIVYSKNEHETGPEWVIMQMMYYDTYRREVDRRESGPDEGGPRETGREEDRRWRFVRRQPLYWYASDLNKPPVGDRKMRWPGREPYEGAFHALFPSWKDFWSRGGPSSEAIAAPASLEQFIETMRRGNSVSGNRVR